MNIYGYKINYSEELGLINKVLSIVSAINNDTNDINNKYLRPKLVEVLSFYILLGYNTKTKNTITNSLNISKKNLNQINSELTKKGYLLNDPLNFRVKHLSKSMKDIKDYFLNSDTPKVMMLRFTNNI